MPRLLPSLLLLLGACGAGRGQRPAAADVTFSGWIYDSPAYEEVLADGALSFALPSGSAVDASQPYPAYPGYWSATLPASTQFSLRLTGEGAYPSVWAGDSPGSDGSWLPGALFAADTVYVDALLLAVTEDTSLAPGALADGAVHLWGMPEDGSDWDCAAVRVAGVAPLCFAVGDEDGSLIPVMDGAFDWFFAFDLVPGSVVVEDGFGGEEVWPTQSGDLVLAFWMVDP